MNDDDLIRRGDAILAVTAADKECLGANGAREFIRVLPTAQPTPDVSALLREALQDALMWTADDQNRAGWRGKARAALAASQPADPVTNAGCRQRSIEGGRQMTHLTDEELDALVKRMENGSLQVGVPSRTILDSDVIRKAATAITALRAQLAEARTELVRRVDMHECAMAERDDATLYSDEQKARADQAEAAMAAQIEAAISEMWCLCEDLEDEAHAKLKLKLTEHEQGFWTAQKMTAKRIRRATQMPTNDRTALDRMLAAAPAAVAPSLRITGPNSDGEYWLHINAGGRSGGVNLGDEHGPICKRLLDAASETGAKE